VEAAEIGPMLHRHRRRWYWPWLCRCGLAFPCGARQVAVDERLRLATRAATDWYPRYFAGDRDPALDAARAANTGTMHGDDLYTAAQLRNPGQWSPR